MAEEGDDKSSKTEAPTDKRLRDARKKGDVPMSRETGALMAVFSLFIIVIFILPGISSTLAGQLAQVYASAGAVDIGTGRAGVRDVGDILESLADNLIAPLAPIFGLLILAALVGVLIQGETVVAVERIKPKLSKLSPLGGFKRIFGMGNLVEFAKSMVKVLIIGGFAVWFARAAVVDIWQGTGFLPESLPHYIRHFAGLLLIATCAFLLPVALGDVIWKRISWMRKQRMSLKEIRDEHKEQEGDPKIKGRRLQMARARARKRMAQAVPKATVILTNPTHYAVALRYEQGVDHAPVCLAKGTDLMARRIREIAAEHNIPVVENRPLARALHAAVEIDETVPVEHWQAVAEIVGYVFDLRRNIRRKPPKGSELRPAQEI